MWFAPQATAALSPVLADFVRGVRLLEEQDNAAAALPLVSASGLAKTPLADYARYYQGLALLELERFDAADAVFGELSAKAITGHLPEDAAFRQGEVKEAKEDFKGAVAIYDALTNRILAQPQLAWLKLGLAADEAGLPMRSVTALQRVYYDYPTTAEADRAAAELDRQDVDIDAVLAPRELARADALFKTRRWTHAKDSYELAKPFMTGADRARVEMRLAACDVALGRYREGRDALKPLLEGPFADEANFHYVNAARGLKQGDEYEKLARAYVDKFPGSPFADEVLNDLASKYIVDDEDGKAEAIFREIVERYPARPVRRARRVESRVVGVSGRTLRRSRALLRRRFRAVPALRLPAVVALLERACGATNGRRGNRCGPAAPGRHRLSQLVLRPSRRGAAGRGARRRRHAPRCGAKPYRTCRRCQARIASGCCWPPG